MGKETTDMALSEVKPKKNENREHWNKQEEDWNDMLVFHMGEKTEMR